MNDCQSDNRDIFEQKRKVVVAGSTYWVHLDSAASGEPLRTSRAWTSTTLPPDEGGVPPGESELPLELVLLVSPDGTERSCEWERGWQTLGESELAQRAKDAWRTPVAGDARRSMKTNCQSPHMAS